jgi:glycosyl-4,4'-diaponeurosporenoate acyltransferase
VLIELPVFWIIMLNVLGWLVIQLGLAWVFTRMPTKWFHPGPAHAWEQGGQFYEHFFAVKWWKDWLPDGARWFAGGFAKGTLLSIKDPAYLARFIAETWRGELCHWLAICCVPPFLLWNPWWGDLLIIAYALAANLPCILVQRYNRLRLARLTAARTPRSRRTKSS